MPAPGRLPWTFGALPPAQPWTPSFPSGVAVDPVRDFMFDSTTGRLVMSGGGFVFTRGLAGVRQALEIELNTLLGEWFLDLTAGVPYFQRILVKTPSLRGIRQVIRERILAVAGVVSVPRLDTAFDRKARSLSVSFVANTKYGQVNASTVVG